MSDSFYLPSCDASSLLGKKEIETSIGISSLWWNSLILINLLGNIGSKKGLEAKKAIMQQGKKIGLQI